MRPRRRLDERTGPLFAIGVTGAFALNTTDCRIAANACVLGK
jgi:hypothetical protein